MSGKRRCWTASLERDWTHNLLSNLSLWRRKSSDIHTSSSPLFRNFSPCLSPFKVGQPRAYWVELLNLGAPYNEVPKSNNTTVLTSGNTTRDHQREPRKQVIKEQWYSHLFKQPACCSVANWGRAARQDYLNDWSTVGKGKDSTSLAKRTTDWRRAVKPKGRGQQASTTDNCTSRAAAVGLLKSACRNLQ